MKYKLILVGVLVVFGVSLVGAPPTHAESCDLSSPLTPRYGQQGAHIQSLQTCLLNAGYNLPAGATGYFGVQTKEALQSFYRTALNIPDWSGLSIGPKGKIALGGHTQTGTGYVPTTANVSGLKRVSSETELIAYIKASEAKNNDGMVRRSSLLPRSSNAFEDDDDSVSADSSDDSDGSGVPSRVSGTNVQVSGIDEPDIVKTDGSTIYFSRNGYEYWDDYDCDRNCGQNKKGITAISAFPLASLGILSDAIKERGEMLLVNESDMLLVISSKAVVAYDVRDPKNPKKTWTNDLGEDSYITAARLKNGKVYLVTSTYINTNKPCPIIPMTRNGKSIMVSCGDIWIPTTQESVDQTYTVLTIDPTTGKEVSMTTVLGSAHNTTVYISDENIYLAYRLQNSLNDIILQYYTRDAKALLSPATNNRIGVITSYDISTASKLNEISIAIEKERDTRSANEYMKFQNMLENGMQKYIATRQREIDQTMITRIPLETLNVASTGVVPGHTLNQFSMDEWNGNLRVAVTVGDRWGMGGAETVNDLYVLDQGMNIVGSVKDLGITERIYAMRMIGNRGYMVTFRETDPFYVFDLSVPSAPKMTGELKIPGYSAYLEPLSETRVLGVGREGDSVKLSIFDVSNPASPKEVAKFTLKEYWTEVEGNHHAFLRDEKHSVFFIPGSEGGYVLSYKGDVLELKAAVSGYAVKRAVYIEDNLYIIGEDKITVFDELTWKEVKTLDLK